MNSPVLIKKFCKKKVPYQNSTCTCITGNKLNFVSTLSLSEETNELKRELDFSRVDVTRAKAELLKAHEGNKKMEGKIKMIIAI